MKKIHLSNVEQVATSFFFLLCNVLLLVMHNNTVTTGIICHDGDVRLANGRQPHEGRVEVCFNETWGTICDYISPRRWNTSEADVVCQHLGYSRAGKFLLSCLHNIIVLFNF